MSFAVYYVHGEMKKRFRLIGTHPFTVYGERFAVTRIPELQSVIHGRIPSPTRYSITHIKTGTKMGKLEEKTRLGAKREGIRRLRTFGRKKVVNALKKMEKQAVKLGLMP